MKRHAAALVAVLALAGCQSAIAPEPTREPEGESGYQVKTAHVSKRFSVAAANPLATQAGYQILQAGGSAVDAAVAVQMVLGLVEPQSSGLGGGAFLMHFDGRSVEAYDGRETAPAAVTEKLFLQSDGKPMGFRAAVVGGRSVGTPGTLRMLELAHREHGLLPWPRLMEPAIELAEQGFPVSARLHALLMREADLKRDPVAAAYFFDPQGQPWPVGHRLRNPELADVLRQIAARGADALYGGEIAQAIVAKVRSHPGNPGVLALGDLSGYRAIKRTPLCFDFRGAEARDYRLCGMPPPSSGTLAIAQIMGLLSRQGNPAGTTAAEVLPQGVPSAGWLHTYVEAARLAYADRNQYVGDPAFVRAPAGDWQSLLAPQYLDQRAQLLGPRRMAAAPPGLPAGAVQEYAPGAAQRERGTSHISIIDGRGQALAMTTTIEDGFGARQMVNRARGLSGGFLLNNELTDFNFIARDAAGRPVANRAEPGKRPRSSMAPTLVTERDTGRLVMTAGSPGGPLIIHFTAKVLIATLGLGLDVQRAIDIPNFVTLGGPVALESGRFPGPTVAALRARGHEVREQSLVSGIQAIQVTAGGLVGGADPRREGLVLGD